MGLRLPPRRRNNRLPGVQETDTGTGTGAGAVNDTCKSGRARKPKRHLGIARIAQSVTPVTVIRSVASAQSRVATLHLFARELLAFLVSGASYGIGGPIAVAQLSGSPTAKVSSEGRS